MDPISQAALGSAVAGQFCSKRLGSWSLLLGACGGALADIDVVWGGLGDPALPWDLHRHFTHALIFIPVGGVLAALPFLLLKKLREEWRSVLLASIVGYATHGFLDAATAWGTYLYWPFSDQRVGWDWISVIDPLFTLPLLVGIGLTASRPKGITRYVNTVGLIAALLYLGFGVVQHERALSVQQDLASSRGHTMEQHQVTPTIGNVLIWRSLYVHEGQVYADGIRLIPGRDPEFQQGTSRPKFIFGDDLTERQRDILNRLHVFAEGYLVQEDDGLIGDQRFSYEIAGFQALWGVKLLADSKVDEIVWHNSPFPEGRIQELIQALLKGRGFESFAP